MARISTHVLDITRGTPAQGIAVELHLVKGAEGFQECETDGGLFI